MDDAAGQEAHANGGQEDLTPDQTEKLLQFQDLTGLDSMDRCREILERHHWDMEVAVQDRFNQEEGIGSVYQERRAEPREIPVVTNARDQRVFTVARRQQMGWFQWGYSTMFIPFRFLYSTFVDLFSFVLRLLRPDPRRHVTDPLGDVVAFINNFEETYGTEHPVFYQGTYSQALNDAKRELKFLLVYLHGDDHQDTGDFCRNTLCNPDVVEFINSRTLFWACNTNSPEGYRVSNALRETTYPFLAIIVLRDTRMTVVARIEGPIDPADLRTRMDESMSDNESSLVQARAEREERSLTQNIRREQDEAFELSLRADQEKARKRREEEEKKVQEQELAAEREKEEERKIQEIERRKEELRNQLPEEPASGDPGSIRVSLKLPSGIRLERRFHRDQSLKHLYNYVFVHETTPDSFEIKTNYPLRTLPCLPTEEHPEPITFAEAGLGKSEMLFVHDTEA